MSIEYISILLFGLVFLFLLTGLPLAFLLGGLGAVFAIAFWGSGHLFIVASAAFSNITNMNLIAIPLFILMGLLMVRTGIADDLYETMYIWLGRLRGGLAIGSIVICTIFGAMSGSMAAAVITMNTIAVPSMLKRGYAKSIAVGTVTAGALLSLIIPPSISMILYSALSGASLGKLYLGGVIPGLIISGLYMTYIGVRCGFQPELGPAVPREETVAWKKRLTSLKSLPLPLALIFFILGGIYSGAVTPLEASAVGATGAIIIALISRRLNWQALTAAVSQTTLITGMVIWLLMGLGAFTSVYTGIGAQYLAVRVASIVPGGGWGMIISMQIFLLFLGMFLDDFAIISICTPIFVPVIIGLGFNPVWFGILFVVNMQVASLSPPYGFSLFFTKSVAPEGVTMVDIYTAVFPFIGLQLICLILIMCFEPVVMWLPNLIIR